MASTIGTVMQNRVLSWLKGSTFTAAPATVYIALWTTAPANDGTGGTEVTTSGTAYARQAITTSTGFSAVSGTNPETMTNANTITWAAATANYGTVVGASIMDASTGGNLLWNVTLGASQTVNSGSTASIAAGAMSINVGT
jgi:hypothetical protein